MVDSRVSELRGNARLIPVDGSKLSERSGLIERLLGQIWSGFVARRRNVIAMRELAALDDALLRDVGIERSQIAASVAGPSGHRGKHGHHLLLNWCEPALSELVPYFPVGP